MSSQDKSRDDITWEVIQERLNREEIAPEIKRTTTGSAVYDFLGQALWKAADEALLGIPGASDVAKEEIYKGEDVTTMEDMFSLGLSPGVEYEEMTGAARAGATVGQVAGMLSPLTLAAKTVSAGIRGGSKLLMNVPGLAKATSVEDLIGIASKMPSKKGINLTETLTKNKTRKIIDDAYDVQSDSNVINAIEGNVSREVYKDVFKEGIKENITDILKLGDEELVEGIAKETVDIVMKNNPDDAFAILQMLGRKIPGAGPKTGAILGAAAYDAAIGFGMASVRAASKMAQTKMFGVDFNENQQPYYTGDYDIDAGKSFNAWYNEAITESMYYSAMGPISFLKGGTQASHLGRLGSLVRNSFKSYWKPIKDYTNKELRYQLTAMDEISGKYLSTNLGKKFTKNAAGGGGKQWWVDATDEESTKAMREMLSAARSEFVLKAPAYWAREFTTDMIASLPRMSAGVVAMNAPRMAMSFNQKGWSMDNASEALGATREEQVANIWTAMFFTRKPHSFHAKMDGKYFNKLFETGNIERYSKFKSQQLKEIVGSLKTFGIDDPIGLNEIVNAYGNSKLDNYAEGKNVIKTTLDGSKEFSEIKEIMSKFPDDGGVAGADLNTSFNKAMADLVKDGKLSYDETLPFYEKLLIAEKILKEYDANGAEGININNLTPDQAMEVVTKISSIKFDGTKLTANNLSYQLEEWMDKRLSQAINIPQQIQRDFLIDVMEKLDIAYNDENGVIRMPDLSSVDFGDRVVDEAISVIYGQGLKNNWIQPGDPISVDKAMLSQENIAIAHDSWKGASERLMSHSWGENWQKNQELDPFILVSDSWAIPYNRVLRHKQRRNAYELLTGGKEHGAPQNDARDILNAINANILTKGEVQVLKPEGDAENYGEIALFIKRLNSSMKSLYPDLNTKNPRVIQMDKAQALVEKVKSVTGDLFSDKKMHDEFNNYIIQKSLRRLGMDDLAGGVDTKASLVTLMQDITFNYQEDGLKPVMPNYGSVSRKLLSAYKGNKISESMYNALDKHYKQLVDNISKSKHPVEFKDNLVETTTDDWITSLQKSLAAGEVAMTDWAQPRAKSMIMNLDGYLSNMDQKIGIIKNIELGVDNISDKARTKYEKELQQLLDDRKVTINLKQTIKSALDQNDPYLLRAISRKDGDINDIFNRVAYNPRNSDRMSYMEELIRVNEDIKSEAQKIVINESNIQDFVKEELAKYADKIHEKDVNDKIMKITTAQFASKYKIPTKSLDEIFAIDRMGKKEAKDLKALVNEILGEYAITPDNIKNPGLKANVLKMIRTLENQQGEVVLDVKNFEKFVVDPLKFRMQIAIDDLKPENKPGLDMIDSDVYAITSNYFSKMPIKTLKIDLTKGRPRLIQGYKVVGETDNRGFTGLIKALDPNQSFIYLAETSAINSDGNVIRNINGFGLNDINASLDSGNMRIVNPQGKADWYKYQDNTKIHDTNYDPPSQHETYTAIPMNESTSIIVRTDKYPGSLHENIKAQFSADGRLFKILEAILDGDITQDKYRAINDKLSQIRDVSGDNALVEGIKLARMILNMPSAIERVVGKGAIDLDHDYIKDRFKRDKLNETKNGYVPTDSNREKTAMMYRTSQSDLFKNVYEDVKDWLEPQANGEFKKLKVLSIDDEAVLRDNNDNIIGNIFSSLDRSRAQLEKKFNDGLIDDTHRDKEIERIEQTTKSIVDGEMYVSKDFYLASMAMIGLHPDMVMTDMNGKVTGFKSGAIKPTITHSKVSYEDANSSDYGKVEEWFAKTAFKYNPLLDDILSDLGIDALTFKSANKINAYKGSKNDQYEDRYAGVAGTTDVNKPWHEYISQAGRITNANRITEIPLDAMSLRTISKQKDPLVGANAAVHMSNDSGVSEWIGVEKKLANYRQGVSHMYSNAYYRTGLAQKVLGAKAETGDPSVVNSAISSILTRGGLVIEPWAQRRLEDNLIGYYLNNGSIAGGIVKDGSLDVMTADMGDLDITVRSDLNDRPVVQFFGEFLPSYYASQKKFIHSTKPELNGVHNVIIQRVEYEPASEFIVGKRVADGFLVNIKGERFLQVEGRYINSKGEYIDIDDGRILAKSESLKNTYNKAVSKEDAVYNLKTGDDYLIDNHTTINDANLVIKNYDKDMAIGMLNSRQPRNMMGDIVISKMAVTGEGNDMRSYVDREAGNVSRMNHSDAITPQDADFDFDKSFNYVAAPGKFWREANKLSGHITGSQTNPSSVLNKIFDPNVGIGEFAKTLPNLFEGEYTNDMILNEVNMARGQFIKMHQTATYLANMFRENPVILTQETKMFKAAKTNIQIRFNSKYNYVATVDNISNLAKMFIDVYKRLPSKANVKQIREIQNQVWFGKDGLFQVGYEDTPGMFTLLDKVDMMDSRFQPAINAIRARIIDPLNKYLKYNQGVETDATGVDRSAKLSSYNNAFVNLYRMTLDPSKNWGIPPSINMEPSLIAARNYFNNSKNSYDIAMQELHRTYEDLNTLKGQGAYGKGFSIQDQIIDFIDNGYAAVQGKTDAEKHNRLFNAALREYVGDEARFLKVLELKKQERDLKFEIDKSKKFEKSVEESENLKSMRARLSNIEELRIGMEESISYMMGEDPIKPNIPILQKRAEKSGAFKNNSKKPFVVIGADGKIKEVIRPGKYNIQNISFKDKVIQNGRRFEATNGEEQKGLRTLFEAFAGLPTIREGTGDEAMIKTLSSYELNNGIKGEYKSIQKELIELGNAKEVGRYGIEDFVIQRRALLYDRLFNDPEMTDIKRKALIMRMLIPNISNKIVSMRSVNDGNQKKAVYDYVFYENGLSEPVLGLLSSLSTGEYRPDGGYNDYAKDVLDDINYLKTAHYTKVQNPNIDAQILTSRMYTEPASIDGHMTKETYLTQDVFDIREAGNDMQKNAARVMIEYATTDKLIDPVILYKAQKALEPVLPVDRQWGTAEYATTEDGNVRQYGVKKLFVSERDALRRQDLGDRGGVQENTQQRVRNLIDCYRSK